MNNGYGSAYDAGFTGNWMRSGTTYYYRAYVQDAFGNRIQGEVLSFTTETDTPSLHVGYIRHTGKQYSPSGFYFNGNYWNYKFTWEVTLTISSVNNVSEWGLQIENSRFPFNSLYPLSQVQQMTFYSNNNTNQLKIYAYALHNGSYILSNSGTVYLNY